MDIYFYDKLHSLIESHITVYTVSGGNNCFQGILIKVYKNYITLIIKASPNTVCDIPINRIASIVHHV